jgi:hypothetical protein
MTAMASDWLTLQHAAFELMSSAWSGLDDDNRSEVLDLLIEGEFVWAMEQLLQSNSTLDEIAADTARRLVADQRTAVPA